MLKFKNFLLLIIILFSNSYLSNIWIEPKDELKIKKLELYSAKNNINIRTTTYPLNLNSLKNSTIYEASFLSDKIELNSLVDKFFKKTERFNSSISLNAFSDDLMIKNPDDNWTSKNSIILKNSYTNKNFSLNLNLHFIEDSYDEKKIIYNGSHISFSKWNLIFGIGFIDRWWGPTHNNNLILSNYAKPPLGLFINTLKGFEFSNRFLAPLGKIDFALFINRLEKNRHIPNPFLVGTRVTFNPLDNLYLGLSRTIMMGGEGKSESFNSFYKAFFEAGGGSGEYQRVGGKYIGTNLSNQLGGYDIKYDIKFNQNIASIYFQRIGEDSDTSSTSLISSYISTLGTEFKFFKNDLLNSIVLEISKTSTEDHFAYEKYNITYAHGIYQSGYRFRGLPIGAFIDADSKYSQLSFLKEVSDNAHFKLDLFYAEPNVDQSGVSVWGSSGKPFYGLKTKYKTQFSKKLSMELILSLTDKKLPFLNSNLDRNILGIITEYNF